MIYTTQTFPYEKYAQIDVLSRPRGNQGHKYKYLYKDIITAFDIETSRIPGTEHSIMYIWQWHFENIGTVIGRTWNDFKFFVEKITSLTPSEYRLMTFVHNLSYEFSFLKGIYDFKTRDIFALKPTKIIKCLMKNIEFRCSYIQTNMSLDEFTHKMEVPSAKIKGFNYNKFRTSKTKLNKKEFKYCINDVKGLVQAIRKELELENDTLYTIPLTSTGYVRRDVKNATRLFRHGTACKMMSPNVPQFQMLRDAFRGGDTHANRFFVNSIIENVKSADRTSSYPDVMVNRKYPITKFYNEIDLSEERLFQLLKRNRALLLKVKLENIELREETCGYPYISKDKCETLDKKAVIDNGRVLEANYLTCTITDVDLRILLREYDFDIEILEMQSAKYGYLPNSLRKLIISYFKGKTELKNVEGKELYYNKYKNLLNSIYGMIASLPVHPEIIYNQLDKKLQENENTEITDYLIEHNSVLPYQWAVWTTAWARYELHSGIWLIEEQGGIFLYSDTDSIKYLDIDGKCNFENYNQERIANSTMNGALAKNPAGEVFYLGTFEDEGVYSRFKTLGSKKYCYEQNNELHITIAGVPKENGVKELKRKGGIEKLKEGFVFNECNKLRAVHNDNIKMIINYNGEDIEVIDNVCLLETTYEVGYSGEYKRLLKGLGVI